MARASSAVRPESNVDLSNPDVNRNPYPYLEEIRALGPAVWNPPSNSWLITSYDDVKSVFSNATDFSQDAAMFDDVTGGATMVSVDNPRHDEMRRVLGAHVSRRAMEAYGDVAREIVNARLDPLIERIRAGETVDVAPAFRAIPTEFISRMMGVPKEDGPQFIEWAQRMTGVYEVKNAPGMDDAAAVQQSATDATKALSDYSAAALKERERSGATDDLLGALASSDVLTEQEKVAHITLMIFGGQDTTETLAKNATVALALHPDQRSAVREDRTLLRPALEEVMRWRAPVFSEVRLVRGPEVQFGGIPLGQGDNVSPVIGAAHRDPARWEHPEVFDIFRPQLGHLGFGFGLHNCLGVNIARLEVLTIFEKLLDEMPEWQLALPDEQLDYGTFYSIRGPRVVPLSV